MNDPYKTTEELRIALKELQQKYDSLNEFVREESAEHKWTVEALKESEYKYKIAFQTSRDSINITERDGTYIDINEGFTNITGFTREDVIGRLSSEINMWAIPEDLQKLSTGLKEKGYVENLESIFRCKDGSLKTAIISANIIVLNNEPHIHVIAHDITDRKHMEELILQSKHQYDNLVSNIPVGVYVLRSKPKGTFAHDYVSPKMANMLDLSIESFMASGDAIFKAIHPDDLEGFVRSNQEGIQLKRPFDWKGRAIVQGVVKWLHISSLPQELECGDILWNGLIADITEQMLAKAEIEHQNEELHKINAEKDKFFSIIAHDLRSPISGFLGITQVMAEELPTLSMEEIQKIAVLMSESATNIYRLLNNLLEWSQVQQGAILFNPKLMHLRIVVDGSIDLILQSAKSKKIEIETDIPNELIVFADANMLQTIVRNLLSNALKFTPKGGKIYLAAKIRDNIDVEISIRDTGIGMSQIILDNLFHLDFQTGRKGTNDEPSSGLGLLLCKEFIEKNNGKLWAESEEGNGSNFYFTLPQNPH